MVKIVGLVIGMASLVCTLPVMAADSDADAAYKKAHAAAKALVDGSPEKAKAFESLAEGEGRTQSDQNGSVSEACANVEAWCWQNAGWQWFLVGDFEKAVTAYENALKCEHVDPKCKALAEKDLATAKAKLGKEQKAASK